MTIGGEKTPAFSAISLNLPQQQADYSQAIADNSRALFASSREYVERYINERYQLGEPPARHAPSPPSRAPLKAVLVPDIQPPTVKETVPVQPAAPALPSPEVPIAEDPAAPAKRKRKRTRKRKTTSTTESLAAEPTTVDKTPSKSAHKTELPKNVSEETIINLR